MQFSKAPPPILTTEAGIVICCRRLQSFNAKSPIFLTLFGIVIFVKDWKEANAAELIVVMPVSYTHLDVYKRQVLGEG